MKLVSVKSAVPLSKDEKALISEIFSKKGERITIENPIDTKIIGGLEISFGSKVIDLTIRKELEEIKKALLWKK